MVRPMVLRMLEMNPYGISFMSFSFILELSSVSPLVEWNGHRIVSI